MRGEATNDKRWAATVTTNAGTSGSGQASDGGWRGGKSKGRGQRNLPL